MQLVGDVETLQAPNYTVCGSVISGTDLNFEFYQVDDTGNTLSST